MWAWMIQSKKLQKKAKAEAGQAAVTAAKLELLAQLRQEGVLSELQFADKQKQLA